VLRKFGPTGEAVYTCHESLRFRERATRAVLLRLPKSAPYAPDPFDIALVAARNAGRPSQDLLTFSGFAGTLELLSEPEVFLDIGTFG
jgi:hypothetical protein